MAYNLQSEDNLTVSQKFAKAAIDIRKLRTLYASVYESINKEEAEQVATMGVDGIKLYYSSSFVDSLTYPEFKFVILHELTHLILKHPFRIGNKNPELWNIACDYIVNALLIDEFGLKIGTTVNGIHVPHNILYDPTLMINNISAEQLYNRLVEKEDNASGLNNSTGANNKDKSNNDNSGKDEKKSNSGQLKGFGKGTEDMMGAGSGAGSEIENMSGNQDGASGTSGESNTDDDTNTSNSSGNTNFGGKSPINGSTDIIKPMNNKSLSEAEINSILSMAKIREENERRETGFGKGNLLRELGDLLKAKVNWQKMLKKYAIALNESEYSFKCPDKRMYHFDGIFPGPSPTEPNAIDKLVVAIDVSGSISQKDLGYFMAEVKKICKTYKINGELLCWDTDIGSKFTINDFKDITGKKNNKIYGGGGTDPACVFKYLDTKKKSKRPTVTVVLTDGYIIESGLSRNTAWKKNYKNTIWVMSDRCNKSFKPAFGKVVDLSNS